MNVGFRNESSFKNFFTPRVEKPSKLISQEENSLSYTLNNNKNSFSETKPFQAYKMKSQNTFSVIKNYQTLIHVDFSNHLVISDKEY